MGSMRKVSRNASPVGGTRATPTSLACPSAASRSPVPRRSTPSDDSVVRVVATVRGAALYRLPAVNSNEARKSRSTRPVAGSSVPSRRCVHQEHARGPARERPRVRMLQQRLRQPHACLRKRTCGQQATNAGHAA